MKSKFLFLVLIVLFCNTSILAQSTNEVDTFYITTQIIPPSFGVLNYSDIVPVPKDSSITFTLTTLFPNTVWVFFVDNVVISMNQYTYTFEHVQANHTFEVEFMPKVEETTANQLVQINPNPTQKEIVLKTDLTLLANNQVEMYNNLGVKVKDFLLSENESIIDLSDLPGGLYFVVLHSKEGAITKRIVKQ